MLSVGSIKILQFAPVISGTVIISEPSLGVLAAKTVSKFNPPSVDNLMFTFAEPGKAVVLFTFQVIVC